jgi:hypothetical protein
MGSEEARIYSLHLKRGGNFKMDKTSLAHVGVKGMKWGIRRYQNKDGSLTPAGKKRYEDSHEDYQRAHDKKSVKQMSDRELRERNNRLQMEKQYADLTRKKSSGKKIINAFVSTAGTITAVAGAYATYKTLANKGLDQIGDWVVKGIDLSGPLH